MKEKTTTISARVTITAAAQLDEWCKQTGLKRGDYIKALLNAERKANGSIVKGMLQR